MKRTVLILVACVGGAACALDQAAFRTPAREHHPETWFHLIGGNVAKAGLAADLDAVASAGISGIQLFHGQFGGPWPGVSPQIPCLSKDWDDLIRFAADGCAARGLSFKMQNCPGWSMSGGPWIEPSNAMRNLTYSRTDVEGGKPVKLALPVPNWQMESRLKAEDLDYHDLFVLAFPTPAGDTPGFMETKPAERTDKDGVLRLVYRFPKPFAFRSLELPSPRQMNHDWAYDPGVTVTVRGSGALGERALPFKASFGRAASPRRPSLRASFGRAASLRRPPHTPTASAPPTKLLREMSITWFLSCSFPFRGNGFPRRLSATGAPSRSSIRSAACRPP